MTLQIHLKSTIVIPGLEADPVALPGDVLTLRDLLNYIGSKIHFELIDEQSGSLKEDLEIIINDKEIWFYPEGLETPIEGDDTVEIHMVPLGGG